MSKETSETSGDRSLMQETANTLPVRRGGRPPISADQRQAFLTSLESSHHIGRAAQAANTSRAAVYRLRESDPIFAAAWDAAMAVLPARVMDAAIEEGIEGRPIYDEEGRVVGCERNTPVLRDMFKKFHDPQKGPTVAVQINNGSATSVATDELPADRLARIDRLLDTLPPPIAGPVSSPEDGSDLGGDEPVSDGSDLGG